MSETTLLSAVKTFAGLTHHFTTEDLDNEGWRWRAYKQTRYAFLQTYLELRQLAADLAHDRIREKRPPTLAQKALAQHHAAYRDFVSLFIGISDDIVDEPPAPDEWPLRRIVAHVNVVEQIFHLVIEDALDQQQAEDGELRPLPKERLAYLDEPAVTAAFDGPLSGSLAYYHERHRHVITSLARLSETDLTVSTLWWEEEPIPVRYRLHRFDAHLREHTIQVEKARQQLGWPLNEASRLLRRIYGALAEVEGVVIGAEDVGRNRRYGLAETITRRTDSVTAFIRQTKFYG